MKRAGIILLFFSIAISLTAQIAPGKYFVEFTDKNNNPYSIDRPWEFLTQRALDRRTAQGITYTETDLPVTPSYIAGVAAVGVTPLVQVKWLNGLIIACSDPTLIPVIEALPYVNGVYKSGGREGGVKGPDKLAVPVYYDYGESGNQIRMMNGDKLHQEGYQGQGKVIAVLDAGFAGADTIPVFDSLWANGQILGSFNFVNPGVSVFGSHPHGTMVLSTMGSLLPGQLIGTAPKADYWLLRTEDGSSEYIIEEYNWVAGAAFADSVGADVINSSLGYTEFDDTTQNHTCADMDGNTTPATRGANLAAQRGIVVVNSAGNEGGSSWMCVGAPSDGTDVLAIAAVDSNGQYAPFSSWGRIEGNYVKPNVAAQGAMTVVSWTDGTIVRSNGTSFSSPLVAGMTASFWSARPELTASNIRAMVEQSASHYTAPDTLTGYGIPDFYKILSSGPSLVREEGSLSVYPNPFTASLTLLITSPVPARLITGVWTVRGEQVFTSEPITVRRGENRVEINLPGNLSQGLYLLKISDQNGRLSFPGKKIEKR